MAIFKGTCKGCGIEDLELFDNNGKCIVCTRLDKIERKLEVLKGIANIKDIWNSILWEN